MQEIQVTNEVSDLAANTCDFLASPKAAAETQIDLKIQHYFVSSCQIKTKCVCQKYINKNDLKINKSRLDNSKQIVNQKTKYHDACFLKKNPNIDLSW